MQKEVKYEVDEDLIDQILDESLSSDDSNEQDSFSRNISHKDTPGQKSCINTYNLNDNNSIDTPDSHKSRNSYYGSLKSGLSYTKDHLTILNDPKVILRKFFLFQEQVIDEILEEDSESLTENRDNSSKQDIDASELPTNPQDLVDLKMNYNFVTGVDLDAKDESDLKLDDYIQVAQGNAKKYEELNFKETNFSSFFYGYRFKNNSKQAVEVFGAPLCVCMYKSQYTAFGTNKSFIANFDNIKSDIKIQVFSITIQNLKLRGIVIENPNIST